MPAAEGRGDQLPTAVGVRSRVALKIKSSPLNHHRITQHQSAKSQLLVGPFDNVRKAEKADIDRIRSAGNSHAGLACPDFSNTTTWLDLRCQKQKQTSRPTLDYLVGPTLYAKQNTANKSNCRRTDNRRATGIFLEHQKFRRGGNKYVRRPLCKQPYIAI